MNKFSFLILIIIAVLLPSSLAAANGGAGSSAAGMTTDLALLIGGVLCFAYAMRIYLLLKGGELSTGWQMVTISFLLFVIAELLSVSATFEIIALQVNAIRVLQVLSLFLILFGVIKIKKSLS